jgi:hypothetical protein
MTESEWDQSTYLEDQMVCLLGQREVHKSKDGRRRLRLFGCASCRLVWHLIPEGACRMAVELAEAYADGFGTIEEIKSVLRDAARFLHAGGPNDRSAVQAVFHTASPEARRVAQAGREASSAFHNGWTADNGPFCPLLRCIFGNPFRPVPFDPRWRTETAVALATGIYVDRAFDRLPILADALEETGCDHPDVLTHCRGPSTHARGCWVVDLLLGK